MKFVTVNTKYEPVHLLFSNLVPGDLFRYDNGKLAIKTNPFREECDGAFKGFYNNALVIYDPDGAWVPRGNQIPQSELVELYTEAIQINNPPLNADSV